MQQSSGFESLPNVSIGKLVSENKLPSTAPNKEMSLEDVRTIEQKLQNSSNKDIYTLEAEAAIAALNKNGKVRSNVDMVKQVEEMPELESEEEDEIESTRDQSNIHFKIEQTETNVQEEETNSSSPTTAAAPPVPNAVPYHPSVQKQTVKTGQQPDHQGSNQTNEEEEILDLPLYVIQKMEQFNASSNKPITDQQILVWMKEAEQQQQQTDNVSKKELIPSEKPPIKKPSSSQNAKTDIPKNAVIFDAKTKKATTQQQQQDFGTKSRLRKHKSSGAQKLSELTITPKEYHRRVKSAKKIGRKISKLPKVHGVPAHFGSGTLSSAYHSIRNPISHQTKMVDGSVVSQVPTRSEVTELKKEAPKQIVVENDPEDDEYFSSSSSEDDDDDENDFESDADKGERQRANLRAPGQLQPIVSPIPPILPSAHQLSHAIPLDPINSSSSSSYTPLFHQPSQPPAPHFANQHPLASGVFSETPSQNCPSSDLPLPHQSLETRINRMETKFNKVLQKVNQFVQTTRRERRERTGQQSTLPSQQPVNYVASTSVPPTTQVQPIMYLSQPPQLSYPSAALQPVYTQPPVMYVAYAPPHPYVASTSAIAPPPTPYVMGPPVSPFQHTFPSYRF